MVKQTKLYLIVALLIICITFVNTQGVELDNRYSYNLYPYLSEQNITVNVSSNNSIYWDGNAWSNTRWLDVDGGNANQEININDENLITTGNITANNINISTLSKGSVLFYDGSNLAQDNSNLFWDDVNKRLGVGTNNPTAKHEIKGTGVLFDAQDASGNSIYKIDESASYPNIFTDNVEFKGAFKSTNVPGYTSYWASNRISVYGYFFEILQNSGYLSFSVSDASKYIKFNIGGQNAMWLAGNSCSGFGTQEPTSKVHARSLSVISDPVFTGTGSYEGADTSGVCTSVPTLNYKCEIDGVGTPATFKWSDDGGSTWDATGVPLSVTSAFIPLNNGVTFRTSATGTNHDIGDYWEFSTTNYPPFRADDINGDRIVEVLSDRQTNFGDSTNYTEIKGDGEINLHGTARVVRHLRVGSSSWKGHGVNAPTENIEGVFFTTDFDNSADDEVWYTLIMPSRWDNSTDVEFAVDWFYDGTQDDGNVTWGLEYKSIKDGEVVTGAGATITHNSVGTHTTGQMIRTNFTAKILATNLEQHDTFGIRLYRDVSDDTLGTDARLINTHFHFIENKFGGKLE